MYKTFTWADIIACILAMLALLFIFIYPYCFGKAYYSAFSAMQAQVLQCTRAAAWADAQALMEKMTIDFYSKRNTMCYFYDHEDINELESYILSARELILREESEQSASELFHALTTAKFIESIQAFDLTNLF